jgi:4,5:9,10-diseco-3-hydroxy-5,9,17-trioxoandrosta-1(10),2-diene-4-oate hydrolase
MGGAISLAYAHRHPKRVKSLILIDPLGVGGSIPWDTAARFLRNAWSGLKLLVNGQKRRDLLDYAEGMGILSSPDSKSENALMEMVAANAAGNLWWMMAGVRFVLADFLTPGKRGAFAHAAGEIERPTLLVWGRKDGLLPVRFADALLSRLPEAYLRIFEHSGHMPMLDEPERFNRLVDDFIKGKLAKKP